MTNERLNERVQGLYYHLLVSWEKDIPLNNYNLSSHSIATGKMELFSLYILTTMPQILIVVW